VTGQVTGELVCSVNAKDYFLPFFLSETKSFEAIPEGASFLREQPSSATIDLYVENANDLVVETLGHNTLMVSITPISSIHAKVRVDYSGGFLGEFAATTELIFRSTITLRHGEDIIQIPVWFLGV
jgi:hypothetical protein